MFDNETPLIAWLAVGSVYVVEGLSKQVSILVFMVHFTERLLFTTIYIERKPGLFLEARGPWGDFE